MNMNLMAVLGLSISPVVGFFEALARVVRPVKDFVIASEAKQSPGFVPKIRRLLRRFTPRNDQFGVLDSPTLSWEILGRLCSRIF